MRLEGPPLYQWLGTASLPITFGVIITLIGPTVGERFAGLVLLALGIAIAARTLMVVTREELGRLTIRNHLRSTTLPIASLQTIRSSQVLVLRRRQDDVVAFRSD